MVELSTYGSGEGPGRVTGRGYSISIIRRSNLSTRMCEGGQANRKLYSSVKNLTKLPFTCP